jgi:hypothetical protein
LVTYLDDFLQALDEERERYYQEREKALVHEGLTKEA